jgi:hypothetical protein
MKDVRSYPDRAHTYGYHDDSRADARCKIRPAVFAAHAGTAPNLRSRVP